MTLGFYKATTVVDSHGIGGVITATELTNVDYIFGRHPGYNTLNGHPLYSCLYIKNETGGTTYNNIVVGISRIGTAKSTIQIGKSPTASITAIDIDTPYNAPTSVTWGTSATIGTLAAGASWGIWLKRTPNSWSTFTSTSTVDADIRLSISATY